MGSHSRESSYEIGIAWPVAFASGRARVVTVGPPSRGRRVGAAAGEEVQGEVGHEDHEEVAKEGHGMSDPQLDQDTDGYADKCKGSDCDTIGHTRGQDGKGMTLLTGADAAPKPKGEVGGREQGSEHSSTAVPSKVGPFLLELLESDASSTSTAEDSATHHLASSPDRPRPAASPEQPQPADSMKNLKALQKEYSASRTAAWVVHHSPVSATIPDNFAPLATFGAVDPTTTGTGSFIDSATPFSSSQDSNPASAADMANSHQQRPKGAGDAPIRGNFIPLSTSGGGRSASPQRQQGVYHLQLSLTDSQVDRLTAVLSTEDDNDPFPRGRARDVDQRGPATNNTCKKENTAPGMRSRSPAKGCLTNKPPTRARSRSPAKVGFTRTPESQRTIQGFPGNTPNTSPKKPAETAYGRGVLMSHGTPTPAGGRGGRGPPPPIDTELARAHAKMTALRVGNPAVAVHHPPERSESPVHRPRHSPPVTSGSSSYYSQDSPRDRRPSHERYPSHISPLRIKKAKASEPKHVNILQEYTDTKTRDSDKESEEFEPLSTPTPTSSGPDTSYTPLAPFLTQGPALRKASKTMIGEGGWLENTSKSKTEASASPTRGGGFLGNLVKKAREMIEANHDNRAQRKSRESDKSRPASRQLAISLSPREQSLLYCELEFAQTTALNDYITAQFNAGRLEADKLKRVAEDWQRKGRPKVVGFRYDAETQLELVRLHVGDFKFYSRAATTAAILGVLDTARANARSVRVRTFCQPDTVIAKQLLDCQGLFNVLGCPEEQQIKLAEIIAFFKAGIERRRVHTMRERERMSGEAAQAGLAAPAAAACGAAATSPVRDGRTARQPDEWWGTAPAGQQRGSRSPVAGRMDPAGYESEEEEQEE